MRLLSAVKDIKVEKEVQEQGESARYCRNEINVLFTVARHLASRSCARRGECGRGPEAIVSLCSTVLAITIRE